MNLKEYISKKEEEFDEIFPNDEIYEGVDEYGSAPTGTYFLKDSQPHEIKSSLSKSLQGLAEMKNEENKKQIKGIIGIINSLKTSEEKIEDIISYIDRVY